MRLLILFCALSLSAFGQTVVKKVDSKWIMEVDGMPFDIKGVTFGYHDDVANYDTYFKDLKSIGVNTIRTWGTDENTPALLDAAERYNIKVMLGIWLRHGRPGMEDDDSFDYLTDNEGMEAMYNAAMETVNTYKNHPAVLTWGVANEVYLNMATDEEKLVYSKFLECVCSNIKQLDANHPITSVEAWTFGLDWWEQYVPSLDIYGLNSYGPGAGVLQDELDKRQIDKPYIVTEFGVTGEWDAPADKNGVKIEPSDKEKYDAIVKGYSNWIKTKPSCLGVYVFHYSSGTDFGGVWLMTHFNDLYRPQYWAIREAFTGKTPDNSVPVIEAFSLPNETYNSTTWIPVELQVTDAENEALAVSFYYNQREGSRRRRNQMLPLNFRSNLEQGFEIQLPRENGAIKVYAFAKDTYGNLGIASTSIKVKDNIAAKREFKVPKAKLPFYVYKDNEHVPYFPSAYMGNYRAMEVDLNHTAQVHSGKTAIAISYNVGYDWYGFAMVDPANDWGDILGGYDISGAKTFSFWAKSDSSNVMATIGFGLIENDKTYYDTAKKSIEIKLTKEWKKYTIKTKRLDLSCIRSGLVIFSSGTGLPHKIYIDDVVFE
ncbi:glycoside hydrolase family 2 TIM barrel-domain containing protein [Winogradskyella aquimaris]|uniref:Endo-1,3-beta-glucanase btgC n=1 Tax=Winogradskyella aquimaris TaxID=864074 RepID=A0ABU5ESP3_9FLAO|nr:glycoside hydrolase family 2 TIM barrel-domain containing protein [Winogradskyella aquimaris]MDY2587789.1 glycoside hydrolase family 2 TIM barrel-domain containing protein [Winogradskyella aquimaris]